MSRHAYSQFCDDVRLETGNKISLMGIYSGQLIVPAVPFAMPKLCCVITCVTPVNQPFSSLAARVCADGIEIAKGEMPSEAIAQIVPRLLANSSTDDPISKYSLALTLTLSPYLIPKAQVLKAYAIADGEELFAGRLYILSPPPAAPN